MREYKPDIFQTRALETWHTKDEWQLLHATLGLAGEVGEVVEDLKKHMFKINHVISRKKRIEEYGDVLYYLSILLHLEQVTFEEVSAKNHEKLTRNKNHHGWKSDD